MLHRADTRNAEGRVAAEAVATQIDEAGVYLTDEIFLYRVAGLVPSALDEIVELEDCYGLHVVRVPAKDLRRRRLRVVTPAPPEG